MRPDRTDRLQVQVGSERYNIVSGCPKTATATIVLRGGAEQVRNAASIALPYRCKQNRAIIGAPFMKREYSRVGPRCLGLAFFF